jgi:hypothetical protein
MQAQHKLDEMKKQLVAKLLIPTRKKKNLQKNKNEIQKPETFNKKTLA